jgi:hypothetical protein
MLSFAAAPTNGIKSSRASRNQTIAGPPQANWNQLGSYLPPLIRQNMVMITDTIKGEVLLFGGQTPTQLNNGTGFVNDTWSFNGERWNQLHPSTMPSPRGYAAAAYDAVHHNLVMFGGDVEAGQIAETWTWDGITWTQQQPAHSPSARLGAGMAFDAATQRVVLFGGVSLVNGPDGIQQQVPLSDTWTWDGNDWTQQSPTISPPARYFFGFADGSATSAPVLFGGNPGQGNVPLVDTWTWNGTSNSWSPQPTVSAPSPRFGPAMAFDPRLGKAVLFGGSTPDTTCTGINGCIDVGNHVVGDTWTWDGTQWTQVNSPGETPPARIYVAMAFDPVRSAMTLFGGVTNYGWQNDTWRFDGSTWIQEDFNAPDELQSAMFAREPNSLGTAVLFGGGNEYGFSSTQTWRWTGSGWTLLHPEHTPLPRQAGTIVFDTIRNVTTLFGGLVDTYGQPGTRQNYNANDVWNWDGTDWTPVNPPQSPPGRVGAMGAFNAARGQLVVFGGLGDSGLLSDTWTWDGNNWTEQHPANSPPARFSGSMAYDVATQQVVLFGGTVYNTQYFNDTWTWNGNDWIEQHPANVPPVRGYTSMAYDPRSSSVILFGGCITCFGAPTDSDTWSWDGANWIQLEPGNIPIGRAAQAMVDGNGSSPVLMFGGRQAGGVSYDSGTPHLNDLWAFAPPVTPVRVVSRKIHGSAGTFDVDLPITGTPSIECRSGGTTNDYTLVFAFTNPLASVAGATVSSGTGTVSSRGVDSTDAHNYIVNLTGVSNAQYLTVTLTNVSDSVGNFSSSVPASIGILVGDVNASGVVTSGDTNLCKAQALQPVTNANFRNDINASGSITTGDVNIIKQNALSRLP